jgi:predicted nuclease with RNAse H fold
MADPFSPDALYQSAREFALSALEAHHAGNHRRVPLYAGTALEHLAKASLARRSPALLAELKNDSSIHSVITLLRIEGAGSPASVRTVGLAGALRRVERFVKSKADKSDLVPLQATFARAMTRRSRSS